MCPRSHCGVYCVCLAPHVHALSLHKSCREVFCCPGVPGAKLRRASRPRSRYPRDGEKYRCGNVTSAVEASHCAEACVRSQGVRRVRYFRQLVFRYNFRVFPYVWVCPSVRRATGVEAVQALQGAECSPQPGFYLFPFSRRWLSTLFTKSIARFVRSLIFWRRSVFWCSTLFGCLCSGRCGRALSRLFFQSCLCSFGFRSDTFVGISAVARRVSRFSFGCVGGMWRYRPPVEFFRSVKGEKWGLCTVTWGRC